MGAVVVWLLLLSCGIGQWSVTAKSSTKKHDSHSHHVVNITNGALRGKKVTTCNGVTYWSFEGIPYALPPVGPNRFKGPQEPQNWTDIREAVEEGSACPHFTDSLKGNEDCLFVNVYTPQNPKYWSTKHPLSVIVSFHSGSWMVGSGNWDIDIPEYMTYGKSVIIVTLNYRLGPLGFLNVDHPNVTANAGLKDQVAALKWVQNNIIYFGGDPNQVTISGKNAGGASVEYHMISPMSAGLFHKGISQSGSTLSYWAFKNDTTQRAFRYINYFGFEVTTIYELVEYFQNISWQELVIYQRYALTYQEQNQHLTPFIPTLEHEQQWGGEVFLPGPPEALIEFGYVHDVPLIFGLNPIKKVIYEDTPTTKNEWIWTVIQEDIERLVPADFNIHRGTDESSEITTKVKEFYFGSKNLSEKLLHRYISYKWDSFFLRGVINSINKHVRNIRVSPVYVFQQYLDITLRENTYCSQELAPYGPLHGKELGSLFSTHSLSQLEVTSSKRTTLNNARLITAWNSFAKTGNPNNKYLPVTWFPATSLSVNALTVRHNFSIATEIHLEQMQFWDKVFSNYSTPSTNYTVIYTNYTVTDDQIDENTTFNTNYTKTLTNYTVTYTNYTIPVNYIGNYTVTSYNYTIPSNTTYAPTNNTIIYVNTTIVDSPNYSVHYYYTGSTSNTTIVYYNNTGSIITNYTVTYYSEGPSTNYTTNSTTTYYYTGPSTNYTTNYTITYSNGTVVYYNTTDVSSTIAYENVDSTIQTSDESADSGEESSSNSSDESSSNSSDESSSNSSDESSSDSSDESSSNSSVESSSNSSVESSSISSAESSTNSSVESSSNSSDESSSNSSDESSSSSSVESSSESSVESSSNSSVESSSNSSVESSSNSSVESSSNSSVESSSNSSVESSSISSVESSSISSVESSSDSSVESSSISSVESSSNSSVESSSNSSVESSSSSSNDTS